MREDITKSFQEVIILSRKLNREGDRIRNLKDISKGDWIMSIAYAEPELYKSTLEFLSKEHLKSVEKAEKEKKWKE